MRRTIVCTNHCGQCHRCFHSLEAFDSHHVRDETGWPICLAPLDLFDRDGEERLVALTEVGECRMYDKIETGVTIWTVAAKLERQRARFSASVERVEPLRALRVGDSLPGPVLGERAA